MNSRSLKDKVITNLANDVMGRIGELICKVVDALEKENIEELYTEDDMVEVVSYCVWFILDCEKTVPKTELMKFAHRLVDKVEV